MSYAEVPESGHKMPLHTFPYIKNLNLIFESYISFKKKCLKYVLPDLVTKYSNKISTVFLMGEDLETVSQIKYIKIMNSEILP